MHTTALTSLAISQRVNVIMPVYNTPARILTSAVDSFLSQIGGSPNWKLIIVDDGSSDPITTSCAQRLASSDKQVVYIGDPRHLGASVARNRGVTSGPHADYYAFLDADDTWYRASLLNRMEMMMQHHLDMVWAPVIRRTINLSWPLNSCPPQFFYDAHCYQCFNRLDMNSVIDTIEDHNPIHLSSLIVSRPVFFRAGGFEPGVTMGEDWLFVKRICDMADVSGLMDVEPCGEVFSYSLGTGKYMNQMSQLHVPPQAPVLKECWYRPKQMPAGAMDEITQNFKARIAEWKQYHKW